jgi:hypothetical protein
MSFYVEVKRINRMTITDVAIGVLCKQVLSWPTILKRGVRPDGQ